MNVNQKLESALTELVNGNIWPLAKPENENPDVFITYNSQGDYADYGDNADTEWEHDMQIHWFAKGHADYVTPRKQIRQALREAGFLVTGMPFFTYESENGQSSSGTQTGYTHMVITCIIDEEDD